MNKFLGTPRAKKAKVLSSTIIYEGPGLRDSPRRGYRAEAVFERHGKSLPIRVRSWSFPFSPTGEIVLIQQYRYAARQYLWELVAGRMDPGETPKKAAARELIEETGFRAKRFRVFLDVFPTPGFLEERMFILLAEGLTAGEAEPEEDEENNFPCLQP